MPDRSDLSKKITRSFAAITALFFVICIAATLGWFANSHRVRDIQNTQILACQQIYSGMGAVFRPLFADPPRTPRRVRHLKEFNKDIKRLKRQCVTVNTNPE